MYKRQAQKRAHNGPGRTGVANGLLGLAAGLVLEPLHGQVGDEQKRDEVQGCLLYTSRCV